MKTLRHAGLSLAAIAMSAWFGTGAAADPIRIGAFLSVSGPASFLGDPNKKAMEIEVEALNKQGGLLGRPVELTVYDDGGATDRRNPSPSGWSRATRSTW